MDVINECILHKGHVDTEKLDDWFSEEQGKRPSDGFRKDMFPTITNVRDDFPEISQINQRTVDFALCTA